MDIFDWEKEEERRNEKLKLNHSTEEQKAKEPKLNEIKSLVSNDLKKENHPNRNTIINEDDIQNLKIALNTKINFEDFLSLV
jgi:ERCC4-related helicase